MPLAPRWIRTGDLLFADPAHKGEKKGAYSRPRTWYLLFCMPAEHTNARDTLATKPFTTSITTKFTIPTVAVVTGTAVVSKSKQQQNNHEETWKFLSRSTEGIVG